MTKTEELEVLIRNTDTHANLKKIWHSRKNDKGEDLWPKGKVMEFLIIRAFEIESKQEKPVYVTYPFGVREPSVSNDELEQIDGAVHVLDLHALIECKDYKDAKIDIEPLVKLRFRLQVRHSSAFGIFFSCTEMTKPAEYWIKLMTPQMIIYWDKEDIEYCLEKECFIECLETKYRMAIDKREYNYPFWQNKIEQPAVCLPLF